MATDTPFGWHMQASVSGVREQARKPSNKKQAPRGDAYARILGSQHAEPVAIFALPLVVFWCSVCHTVRRRSALAWNANVCRHGLVGLELFFGETIR